MDTMGFQVPDLRFPGKSQIACRSNYFHLRGKNSKTQIETHLIVSCSCTPVSDILCSHFFCIVHDSQCLESPFGAHRYRVGFIPQNITEHHITDTLLIIILCHIQVNMFLRPQCISFFFDSFQLGFGKSSGICQSGIYFQAQFFTQVFYTIRGIQSSAIGQYYFFFHGFILTIKSLFSTILQFRCFVFSLPAFYPLLFLQQLRDRTPYRYTSISSYSSGAGYHN